MPVLTQAILPDAVRRFPLQEKRARPSPPAGHKKTGCGNRAPQPISLVFAYTGAVFSAAEIPKRAVPYAYETHAAVPFFHIVFIVVHSAVECKPPPQTPSKFVGEGSPFPSLHSLLFILRKRKRMPGKPGSQAKTHAFRKIHRERTPSSVNRQRKPGTGGYSTGPWLSLLPDP